MLSVAPHLWLGTARFGRSPAGRAIAQHAQIDFTQPTCARHSLLRNVAHTLVSERGHFRARPTALPSRKT